MSALILKTQRMGDADSAAAFLSDLWGMNVKSLPDGRYETLPDRNVWGIEPQPIVQTAAEIMIEAAYHGWHA